MIFPKDSTHSLQGRHSRGAALNFMLYPVAWLCLMLSSASAQLCFDIFLDDTSPLLQCADADYFVDAPGGGFEFESFGDSDTDPLDAEFDGFDIFDPAEPELEPPDNLLEPFFARNTLTPITDAQGDTTGFSVEHRGSVSLTPSDTDFQSAAFQTRSRITVVAMNTGNPDDPIELELDIDFDFELADPIENATTGAALGGLGVKISKTGDNDPLEPEFDFSVLAELDTIDIDDELDFFGFDDPDLDDGIIEIDFEPPEPDIDDTFDIEIDIDIELDDELDDELGDPIMSGDELIIELDTFGSIFTDGFESGDTAAWTMSSPDTMRLVLTSPDPNVTFIIVGLEDPVAVKGDMNGDGVVTIDDIPGFVDALTNPGTASLVADINGDGVVNNFDIQPFIDLLLNPGTLVAAALLEPLRAHLPPVPELDIVQRANGDESLIVLQFDSEEGRSYAIEASADLKTFTNLTTLQGDGEPMEFAPPQAKSNQFYRLVAPLN